MQFVTKSVLGGEGPVRRPAVRPQEEGGPAGRPAEEIMSASRRHDGGAGDYQQCPYDALTQSSLSHLFVYQYGVAGSNKVNLIYKHKHGGQCNVAESVNLIEHDHGGFKSGNFGGCECEMRPNERDTSAASQSLTTWSTTSSMARAWDEMSFDSSNEMNLIHAEEDGIDIMNAPKASSSQGGALKAF